MHLQEGQKAMQQAMYSRCGRARQISRMGRYIPRQQIRKVERLKVLIIPYLVIPRKIVKEKERRE